MKRARLIYNPTSGREAVRRQLPDILDILEGAGYETSCHATTGEGDATREAALAVERDFDLIVVAGGDGTIYEVINGIAEKKNRPELGIIPCGTTNDLARALGLPKSITKACQIIAAGRTRPIDVGKINNRYFINIAGGGTLTELTYEVPSKLKTIIGHMAYYIKGIEKLPSISPTHIRIETRDGVIVDEEIMLFLISNSNSVGGFEKLAPHANLGDGKLDCLVLKKTNLAELLRIVSMALKGDHIKDPHVIYFQTDYIKATAKDNHQVLINLDGELGGQLPCECYALGRHLNIFVP
ncbi:diacylglycerol kinase [Brevibacillus daliensis]|uniref:diacylglycerol kinase n=1 Tax=Brevibacillus daliensis TaxID=2892995 RepID=UPI001E3BC83F|nr:diacylglycerol kinase [Brevibacillus daliensis]